MKDRTIIALLLTVLSAWTFLPPGTVRGSQPFRRGDANADGAVDLGDAIDVLVVLFQGSPDFSCRGAADADGDVGLDLTDVIFLLGYLFQDGSAPPSPGAVFCGIAPPDSLDCESYPSCGGPPEIVTGPAASPAETLPGERVNLSVGASDPGDKLTFSWSQIDPPTPLGTFVSGKTAAAAVWRPPAVGAVTPFTLEVTVSDPAGHSVTGTASVMVELPAYGASIQPIWNSNCSCHAGAFPSGNLSLDPGKSHSSLVNVAAGICRPQKRVLPFEPDSSVLYKKIAGTACGSRMPPGNSTFFDSNPNLLIRIRSWILAGALND